MKMLFPEIQWQGMYTFDPKGIFFQYIITTRQLLTENAS